MPNAARTIGNRAPGGSASESADADAAKANYTRIACALVGTSAAQLASYIGNVPESEQARVTAHPTRTLEELSRALRVAIGWFQRNERDSLQTGQATPSKNPGLAALVRTYLALQSEWEIRESLRLAADMSRNAERGRIASSADAKAVASSAPGPAMGRRALLVDDASEMLITVEAFLGALGFEVVQASNGDRALQILASDPGINLLMTDHAMPDLSGKDLVLLVRERFPRLRTLVITGFPNAQELGTLPPSVALLTKPFRRAELAVCIQRLFNASQSGCGAHGLIGAA
ncbi:MAG TPA: response regulator [Acetobacteraceae bacterium]|nr:response regulator [Acetobacteraceae bacterium]